MAELEITEIVNIMMQNIWLIIDIADVDNRCWLIIDYLRQVLGLNFIRLGLTTTRFFAPAGCCLLSAIATTLGKSGFIH